MVVLLPAAVFALCAGSSLFPDYEREFSASDCFVDVPILAEDGAMVFTGLSCLLIQSFSTYMLGLPDIDILVGLGGNA